MQFIKRFALLVSSCAFVFNVARADEVNAEKGVQVRRDITFLKRGGKSLHLHLLRPSKLPARPLPVVIWVHGGLWRSGSHDKMPPLLSELSRRGYAVASVEFRSSQQATFPAQLDDLRAATRFLRSNSRAYSLDGAKIGVAGISTGGHLASLLGLSGAANAVAEICGPTDLTTLEKGSRLDWNEEDGPVFALLGGSAQEKAALSRAASPVSRVSKKAPPFLILHGDGDSLVPVSQSEALFQKLKNAGTEVSYRVYAGEEHGLRGVKDQTDAEIIRFFDKWLKAPVAKAPAVR